MFKIDKKVRVTSGRLTGACGMIESYMFEPRMNCLIFLVKYDEPLKGYGQFKEEELEAIE